MVITATELKSNLGKFLAQARAEDILISKNGEIIARLTSPYTNRVVEMSSLFGILPSDVTLEEAKEARGML